MGLAETADGKLFAFGLALALPELAGLKGLLGLAPGGLRGLTGATRGLGLGDGVLLPTGLLSRASLLGDRGKVGERLGGRPGLLDLDGLFGTSKEAAGDLAFGTILAFGTRVDAMMGAMAPR